MALTAPQRTTLKAFIDGTPEFAAYPMNQDGYLDLATRLNQAATPTTFFVWRSSVPIDEIMRNGMDWTLVDGLTVGKARIWEWLGRLGVIDASKVNVRAGIDEAWKGTGAALVAVRANIYAHCKRPSLINGVTYAPGPSVVEKLFADVTGGNGAAATPATLTFEGSITWQDVAHTREG